MPTAGRPITRAPAQAGSKGTGPRRGAAFAALSAEGGTVAADSHPRPRGWASVPGHGGALLREESRAHVDPLSASQVRLCARCCALLRLPPEPPGYFQAYLAERLARHDPALLDLVQRLSPGEVRELYDAIQEVRGTR
jgi:hypothetical protein